MTVATDPGTQRLNPGVAPGVDAELTAEQRLALGKSLRKQVRRRAHAAWQPAADRPSVVEFMRRDDEGRLDSLLPIRYQRMSESAFAYFRGSASVMAFDVAGAPSTGVYVQLAGDAHLLNYGILGSPTGRLLFDVNDFDETLPGPWEYDVKRLAASATIASRANSLDESTARAVTLSSVRSYRLHTARLAGEPMIAVWDGHADAEELVKSLPAADRAAASKTLRKAEKRSDLQAAEKLSVIVDGKAQIVDRPPLVDHGPFPDFDEDVVVAMLQEYGRSLSSDRRQLLERYRYADFALKVVGVGSVGTHDYAVLLEGSGGSGEDPLLLQLKEAKASCLEPYFGSSGTQNHAERVVYGQRICQSASDVLLGWSHDAATGRSYYWRQLWDHKGSFEPSAMSFQELQSYVAFCGRSLAYAHARAGAAGRISGYLGRSDVFDRAIADFAALYADQMERDHAALVAALDDGRLPSA